MMRLLAGALAAAVWVWWPFPAPGADPVADLIAMHSPGPRSAGLRRGQPILHAAERLGIPRRGICAREHDGLITTKTGRLVDRLRVPTLVPRVGLCADDEERAECRQGVQALEVEIGTIHHIEGPRLGDEAVERVNIGHFVVGHMQERRNRAAQVEQRVELDRGFRGPERGPRKHGQTQIDGRSVQGKHRVVEIQSQVLVGVHRPCNANQLLRDIGVDSPVALLVRVGQRVLRDTVFRMPK